MELSKPLRDGLGSLVALAAADLSELWKLIADYAIMAVNEQDPAAHRVTREALNDVLPGLITEYQSAATSLAADLYDTARDDADLRGFHRAKGVELPHGGYSLAGWALKTAASPGGLVGLVDGGVTRRIMQAGNQTVMQSAVDDPDAEGWQRQARGDTCGFCLMLAARGTVYIKATADFAAHDKCDCVAVAAFSGQELPVKPWTPNKFTLAERDRRRQQRKKTDRWIEQHAAEIGLSSREKVEPWDIGHRSPSAADGRPGSGR